MKTCSIDGCEKPRRGRGWCSMHYDRWRRNGDPLKIVRFEGNTLEETLAHYLERQGDCLVWTGQKNRKGYGLVFRNGKANSIHKLLWERENGPTPLGLKVDHICHNKACGELTHLRLATNKQNAENRQGATRVSKTGIRGASLHRQTGKYVSQVQHNSQRIYLGLYDTAEEAGEVARLKRRELFTHNDLDRSEAA